MRRRVQIRDPIAAHQRKTVAVRRVGLEAQCACGESRPEALLSGSNPALCAACDRTQRAHSLIARPPASASSRAYSSSLTFVPMDFLRKTGFTMPTLLLPTQPPHSSRKPSKSTSSHIGTSGAVERPNFRMSLISGWFLYSNQSCSAAPTLGWRVPTPPHAEGMAPPALPGAPR